jgi:hypothetical protein
VKRLIPFTLHYLHRQPEGNMMVHRTFFIHLIDAVLATAGVIAISTAEPAQPVLLFHPAPFHPTQLDSAYPLPLNSWTILRAIEAQPQQESEPEQEPDRSYNRQNQDSARVKITEKSFMTFLRLSNCRILPKLVWLE